MSAVDLVTPNFRWSEFASHDATPVPANLRANTIRLCQFVLEPLRARWGGPLIVVSGYRSPQWNTHVGGAMNSQHMKGTAADVRPSKIVDIAAFQALIDDMLADGELPEVGGCGHYSGWSHLDIRPKPANGHIARWTGSQIGDEQT